MTNEIEIFDRSLIKRRREKAALNFSKNDFILNLISNYTRERLGQLGNKYKTALDLGCHTGQLGKKLLQDAIIENVVNCDLSMQMLRESGGICVVADEEFLPFAAQSFNLITSSMSLHWVNDLPGSLIQIRKCLKNDGMFIATMPGIETLKELRSCLMEAEIEITGGTAPHISPFADVKTLGHLLQRAGFARSVADSETIQVSYEDIFAVMADLKNNAEQNALIKRAGSLRKKVLKLAAEKYKNQYPDNDGGVLATIEIITITGLAG